MRELVAAAARALDGGRLDEARDCLMSLPFARCDRAQRLVAVALWKRVLSSTPNSNASRDRETAIALNSVAAAATRPDYVWSAYQAIPVLEERFGPAVTAALAVAALWDCVLTADSAMFKCVFELFFRAGGERCIAAYEQFLIERTDCAPSYWDFVLLTKSGTGRDAAAFAALAARIIQTTQRTDLAPLFDVYLKQMRQASIAEIVATARALKVPSQRMLIAECMLVMGYSLGDLRTVVACCEQLVGRSATGQPIVDLLHARLAAAECRWNDVVELAERTRADARFCIAADLLRALALARLKKTERATALLDDVNGSPETSPFDRARSAFIRVTTELIRRGSPLPEQQRPEIPPATVGRPLAQSLWVGRSLRWIERLCIKSYLDNGWRFQLYVYDEPDNVPEGCEVLDATAIIPAKDVFREGHGSGSHAGSVGAFSDLFRYRLLSKRGGMWTDTDVINFKKFEPDGQRFISTELTDAGLVTLNGAIMAAPAGDELVSRAYDRARAILDSDDKLFFTRIGPYLLAEVALELGVDKIKLMPPAFLGPVSWMNTATLLQPFDVLMTREEFQQAINVHVYTETWRTLGLGLDRPPGPQTFLGRLYADHCGEESAVQERVSA